jgi:hypothetical protein
VPGAFWVRGTSALIQCEATIETIIGVFDAINTRVSEMLKR